VYITVYKHATDCSNFASFANFHLTKYFTATWALEGHNPQAPDKLYAHGK